MPGDGILGACETDFLTALLCMGRKLLPFSPSAPEDVRLNWTCTENLPPVRVAPGSSGGVGMGEVLAFVFAFLWAWPALVDVQLKAGPGDDALWLAPLVLS